MTMGKKSRNRSAKAGRDDGSCPHAGSAVAAVKKSLAKEPQLTSCRACRQEQPSSCSDAAAELFVCLRCCLVCCRRHVGVHSRAPRADLHCHFLSLQSGTAHCLACAFRPLDEEQQPAVRAAVLQLEQTLLRTAASPPAWLREQDDWRATAMRRVQAAEETPTSVRASAEKAEVAARPAGLVNLGATCYMNSSLQSLAACRPVRACFANFLQPDVALRLASAPPHPARDATFPRQESALPERLAEVLRRVRPAAAEWAEAGEAGRCHRAAIVALKSQLTQRWPQFANDWTEQDAHEFLRHLLDMASDSSRRRCPVAVPRRHCSGVEAVFRSTLLCVKHCHRCDLFSTNTEAALDISVALDREATARTLPDCAVGVAGAGEAPVSKHRQKKAARERRRQRKGRAARAGEETVDADVQELFGVVSSPSRRRESSVEATVASSSEDDTCYDLFADDIVYSSASEEETPPADADFLAACSNQTERHSRLATTGFLEEGKQPTWAEWQWDDDSGDEDAVLPLFSDLDLDALPLIASPAPPAENGEIALPTESELAPPTELELAPPTESELAPPTESELAPPTESELAPPTESELAQPTESELAPPTESELAPPEEDKEEVAPAEEEESEKDLDAEEAQLAQQPLVEKEPASGLEALLEKHFEGGILHDFKCPRCHTAGSTSRRQLLVELPEVLVVSVKRFRGCAGQTKKVGAMVDFPVVLDLRPFTSRVAPGLGPLASRYRLRAVVQHQGSARTGHYVAYVAAGGERAQVAARPLQMLGGVSVQQLVEACRAVPRDPEPAGDGEATTTAAEEEKWFLVSDLSVSAVSLQTVRQAEAYILFYERA